MSRISSSPSDHIEVDDVEEMLATLGSFGIFPGMGAAEGARDIYWVDDGGSDANDGTTAALAKATIDAGFNLLSGDDILFILGGNYDENANTGGVMCDTGGVHVFGVGMGFVTVDNSNVSSTAVFTVASRLELAGITIDEVTNTVEGIKTSAGTLDIHVHDMIFDGAMENGFGVSGCTRWKIFNCEFYGMTNDGIEIAGASTKCHIFGNKFYNVADIAISFTGDDVDGNFVDDNRINGGASTTTTGIAVALGDENSITGNIILECANVISDTGSNNGWVNNHADVVTGSFTRTNANGTSEVNGFTNIDLWTTGLFEVTLSMRVATDGGTWTFELFEKTDTTNFEEVDIDTFIIGTDVAIPRLKGSYEGGDSKLQLSHATSVATGDTRTINYKIRCIGQ